VKTRHQRQDCSGLKADGRREQRSQEWRCRAQAAEKKIMDVEQGGDSGCVGKEATRPRNAICIEKKRSGLVSDLGHLTQAQQDAEPAPPNARITTLSLSPLAKSSSARGKKTAKTAAEGERD
jgi:hypothetical protein